MLTIDLPFIPPVPDDLTPDYLYSDNPPFPLRVDDPDSWRPIVPEARSSCTLFNIEGFGNFVPLWTNGILVLVWRACRARWDFVHHENIDWSKPERAPRDTKSTPRDKKPRATREVNITLDDLLS